MSDPTKGGNLPASDPAKMRGLRGSIYVTDNHRTVIEWAKGQPCTNQTVWSDTDGFPAGRTDCGTCGPCVARKIEANA